LTICRPGTRCCVAARPIPVRSDVWSSIVSSAFAAWTLAIWPIAHREEGADVAGARHFEAGLLLLEHPPQGLWSLHLVPQHPRIHPDVSGRALERRAGCGESTLEAFGRRPQCSWHRPWWAVIRNPSQKKSGSANILLISPQEDSRFGAT